MSKGSVSLYGRVHDIVRSRAETYVIVGSDTMQARISLAGKDRHIADALEVGDYVNFASSLEPVASFIVVHNKKKSNRKHKED